jgi:dienelactone hydrolase
MCDLDGCGAHNDMPPIELSDKTRRAFLAGVVSLPLASILFHLELARAQAAKLTPISIKTKAGNSADGFIAMPAKLAKLTGLGLGHFGTEDKFINKKMVDGFEVQMKEAGKSDRLSVHWYTANHAFANPTGARYDSKDAATAWQRTTAFFAENLKG